MASEFKNGTFAKPTTQRASYEKNIERAGNTLEWCVYISKTKGSERIAIN
jgi:hypothetical protein